MKNRRRHPTESPCSFVKQRYAYLARMIAKTRQTQKEHAYSICISPQGSAYIMGECSGKKCSIHPVPCPKDSVRAVNHTHPLRGKKANDFSIADFYSGIAVNSPFDCLYATTNAKGKCVVYKPFLTEYELDFLQACHEIERNARKDPREWEKGLDECYKNIHRLVGKRVCTYSLKKKAKWYKKRRK